MKSGFIAIVGRPNAGKSTLLNAIMNQKLAIISPKPQTTRNNIQGILTTEDAQMVFIDTPGIHKPHHELGRTLNKSAFSSLAGVDLVYYMVDASVPFGSGEEFVLNNLKEKQLPIFLILNKVDLLSKEALMKLLIEWQERLDCKEIFPVSALKHDNIHELLEVSKNYLNEGPKYFPDDMICDHDEDFMITELIREKVLYKTEEEIPHSVAVVLEKKVNKKSSVVINALIIVERPSQKGILIGKQGSMIKDVGIDSRRDLELILGKKVYLELYVRVEKDWRNRASKLQQFGIREMDEDDE